MGGTCSTYREVRNIYEIVAGTRETYKTLGTTRRRKANIILAILRDESREDIARIQLAHYRIQGRAVVTFRVLYKYVQILVQTRPESCQTQILHVAQTLCFNF
jgi:predicted transcriptional regulator